MKKGLVIGKFMPLHNGHLALIDFAQQHCTNLIVLLCYHGQEPISGLRRMQWLRETFLERPNITLLSCEYDPTQLTDSSEANPMHAASWAAKVRRLVPDIDVVFSSEEYGEAFAAHLQAKHVAFDKERLTVPVSASLIREKPFTFWSYLPPAVRPFFVKKIALVGSESTGKSTLAERLASYYQTVFVPEMAREVIGHTDECTEQDLQTIAALQARTLLDQLPAANKLIFSDTELTITKSYAHFLFGKALHVPAWIEDANKFDLYLFLQTDCPYVQDGTRLTETERDALQRSHEKELEKSGVRYKMICGHWEDRFTQACHEIDQLISKL